ncbi:reduced folate transporter isoform X5 [Phacochoerus africanus]|nr:reduced folate transporter isoform X5 [Phacochoerus africanus]
MQLMEFFFSITMAARIAYSSYIFALVPPARYQRVAGYSRAAVLLGVFTSSVLGQLLVTMGRVPFSTLNYVSLAFLLFSLVLTLFLKRPQRSLFFNRSAPAACELDPMRPGGGPAVARAARRDSVLARLLGELARALRLPQLRLWSLWWVFNSAGYYLVVYYVHILWNVVHPTADSSRVYNGGADAASTLLDPLGAVGEAGHRRGDGRAGGARLPHVQHEQHLAVLRRLRALPRRLPVPGAHRHPPGPASEVTSWVALQPFLVSPAATAGHCGPQPRSGPVTQLASAWGEPAPNALVFVTPLGTLLHLPRDGLRAAYRPPCAFHNLPWPTSCWLPTPCVYPWNQSSQETANSHHVFTLDTHPHHMGPHYTRNTHGHLHSAGGPVPVPGRLALVPLCALSPGGPPGLTSRAQPPPSLPPTLRSHPHHNIRPRLVLSLNGVLGS